MINTSPEPRQTGLVSIGENITVVGDLWVALNHPAAFFSAVGFDHTDHSLARFPRL